jgi:hypothetical protein
MMPTGISLGNHGRTRQERNPIEFSFHDFDFLCVVVFELFC